jgi:hypothetical protein
MALKLHLKLLSDATFGRGEGVAGLVDTEVEHDEYGFPLMRGRTLKGLLTEECDNLRYALSQQWPATDPRLEELGQAAASLFGEPGSTANDEGGLHIGPARLAEDFRQAVIAEIESKRLTSAEVLESLTAIRRQTAIDSAGAPKKGSLRALRVVLRETEFSAELAFIGEPPGNLARGLLAASVMCLHRAGTGRNRGRGRLKAWLCEDSKSVTDRDYSHFKAFLSAQGEVA